MADEKLLEVVNLEQHFPVTRGVFGRQVGSVRAVDGVSFDIKAGETLGLVGESGCGKTTVGRTLLRLIEPSAGTVRFMGKELGQLGREELAALRRDMQIIFQDPFSSLNPRMRVLEIVGEGLRVHKLAGAGRELDEKVAELLSTVGISRSWMHRYPHEFSGGQRQRIGIARALATAPKLIVCDEAVSALDVSIQAQVVNLLSSLRKEFGLAYLFISHDLSVVRHISDRVAVMYLGEIVELCSTDDLFKRPAHPYTRALLSAVPVPDPKHRTKRLLLHGDVPSPQDPPSGCRFHPRCPAALASCRVEVPVEVTLPGKRTVCCVHAAGLSEDQNWFELLDARIREASTRSAEKAPFELPMRRSVRRAEAWPAPEVSAQESDASPQRRSHPALVGVLLGLGLVLLGQVALGVCVALVAHLILRRRAARPLLVDVALALGVTMSLVVSSELQQRERVALAQSQKSALMAQVEAYRKNTGSYPATLDDLGYRLFDVFDDGTPRDPWQRVYQYSREGDRYRLSAEGALTNP